MQFLAGQPALMIGKNLIIADLHFGIEYELGLESIVRAQAQRIVRQIKELAEEYSARRIVVLGDVRHLLPKKDRVQLPEFGALSKTIPLFFSQIGLPIVVIKGNHDGGLRFGPGVAVKGELLLGSTLLVHGHRWPTARSVGKCRRIVCAHTHPCWAFADASGHRELKKVFAIGHARAALFKKYGLAPRRIDIVVVPAFNEVISGVAVNEGRAIGPLLKKGIFKLSHAYLLSGVELA